MWLQQVHFLFFDQFPVAQTQTHAHTQTPQFLLKNFIEIHHPIPQPIRALIQQSDKAALQVPDREDCG